MKGQNLPAEHHIVRLVSYGRLLKDQDGNPIGISFAAFQRNPEHDGLSVTWLEYFAGERPQRIERAVRAIRASLTVGGKAGFAIGQVAAIAKTCEDRHQRVRIIHWPEDDNKAHAEVRQLPRDDQELLEDLATGSWSELVLNASIPPGEEAAPDEPAEPIP